MNFDTAVQVTCLPRALLVQGAVLALRIKDAKQRFEELSQLLENRSCACGDAIRQLTAAPVEGNLIFKDTGNMFTRTQRETKPWEFLGTRCFPRKKAYCSFAKLRAGTASSEEKKFEAPQRKSQRILEMPEEELFRVSEVNIEPPEKAIIYPTVICSKCGEGFMEPLGRVKNGEIVCISCFEAKNE